MGRFFTALAMASFLTLSASEAEAGHRGFTGPSKARLADAAKLSAPADAIKVAHCGRPHYRHHHRGHYHGGKYRRAYYPGFGHGYGGYGYGGYGYRGFRSGYITVGRPVYGYGYGVPACGGYGGYGYGGGFGLSIGW